MALVRSWTALLLTMAVAMPAVTHADTSTVTTDELSVRLVSDQRSVKPASDFRLGLKFQMQPGWHIYWLNPGAAGLPTSVKWQLSPGLSADEIRWPTPSKIREPGVAVYGYTGAVLLPIAMHADGQLKIGQSANVVGNVAWTVCADICVPGKAVLHLGLPVSADRQAINTGFAADFDAAQKAMPHPVPADWEERARIDGENIVLEVDTGHRVQSAEFYPFAADLIDDAADQAFTAQPKGFALRLTQSQFMTTIPKTVAGLVVTGAGEAVAVVVPLAVSGQSSVNVAASVPQSARPSADALGLGLLLWFAFLGGLILNLMPCVLPVLSLKVLGLASAGHKHASWVRQQGLFYLLGILVSFWILATVLVALRIAGQQIGWGFQMQSPIVVIFLAGLLFLIGLNLLGMFEIGGSWMGAGSSLADRPDRRGSFFTGVLATVVATPCTAPFMGVAIGVALTQSAWSIFLTFSSLALGLASPYVLLTLRPQWARILPKPGAWMIRFRQALAFPMFCAVIWLVWVLTQQRGATSAGLLLLGLLMVAMAVWLLTAFQRGVVRNIAAAMAITLALTLSVAGSNGSMTPPLVAANAGPGSSASLSASQGGELQWEAYSPERLMEYRSQLRPVLVDFTAAWCVTCLIYERTVLHSADVRRQLTAQHVTLLKADWTSYDATITSTLKEYGRVGVPFFLLYGRSDTPLIATESLSTGKMLQALDTLRQQASSTSVALQTNQPLHR